MGAETIFYYEKQEQRVKFSLKRNKNHSQSKKKVSEIKSASTIDTSIKKKVESLVTCSFVVVFRREVGEGGKRKLRDDASIKKNAGSDND